MEKVRVRFICYPDLEVHGQFSALLPWDTKDHDAILPHLTAYLIRIAFIPHTTAPKDFYDLIGADFSYRKDALLLLFHNPHPFNSVFRGRQLCQLQAWEQEDLERDFRHVPWLRLYELKVGDSLKFGRVWQAHRLSQTDVQIRSGQDPDLTIAYDPYTYTLGVNGSPTPVSLARLVGMFGAKSVKERSEVKPAKFIVAA
jgi:hypothetical protein